MMFNGVEYSLKDADTTYPVGIVIFATFVGTISLVISIVACRLFLARNESDESPIRVAAAIQTPTQRRHNRRLYPSPVRENCNRNDVIEIDATVRKNDLITSANVDEIMINFEEDEVEIFVWQLNYL